MNRVPIADRLVWAQVMRPQMPLVYLDINHLIELARSQVHPRQARAGYPELLESARRAVQEDRAGFPLSGEHLWEISAIKSPRQRRDVADMMEELSTLNYLLGRIGIAQLEIEAGIRDIVGEAHEPLTFPLIRPTFGQAFAMRGRISIKNSDGSDASDAVRQEMGSVGYEEFIRRANYSFERATLDGPSDGEVPTLHTEYGYAPEESRRIAGSRLAFELDLSKRLDGDQRWRRGRLRDVVSAREVAHEWLDTINRVNEQRAREARYPLVKDDEFRRLTSAMPHSQVAISIKTQYHRDPNHRWDINDITDIDAASVAYAYCDAVFTDKAVRAALANSTELRPLGTYLPRTPHDLSTWLDDLPTLAFPAMLVPASAAARTKARQLNDGRVS